MPEEGFVQDPTYDDFLAWKKKKHDDDWLSLLESSAAVIASKSAPRADAAAKLDEAWHEGLFHPPPGFQGGGNNPFLSDSFDTVHGLESGANSAGTHALGSSDLHTGKAGETLSGEEHSPGVGPLRLVKNGETYLLNSEATGLEKRAGEKSTPGLDAIPGSATGGRPEIQSRLASPAHAVRRRSLPRRLDRRE